MSGGYKGVYDRLADDGPLVIAFTLDGPIITQISFRHQVYTKIFPAEILFSRKFLPKPNLLQFIRIARVRLEPSLHQFLKLRSLFSFGKRSGTESLKYFFKCHCLNRPLFSPQKYIKLHLFQ